MKTPAWILYLTTKGEANFINKIAIVDVTLLFRCENSENGTKCGIFHTVEIDMLDDSTFKRDFECYCGNHFRIEEQYSGFSSDSFNIYGDYSLAKTSMTDSEVTWVGDVFGYRVEINTSCEGSWKMDKTEFFKIAPSEMTYIKRDASEDVGYFKLNSSSGEDDSDEEGLQYRVLKRIRKEGKGKNVGTVGVEGLCPYTVSLRVVARMEERRLASSEESMEVEGPKV